MPLITPVFGLPPSAVDRLTDSEAKNRQRERQKGKDSEQKLPVSELETSASKEAVASDASHSIPESQNLDSETVVKLLDEQVTPQTQNENRSHSVSDAYNHVKNLTTSEKTIREV